jgi:hypothetical protein
MSESEVILNLIMYINVHICVFEALHGEFYLLVSNFVEHHVEF